jgi:hypothetical protein
MGLDLDSELSLPGFWPLHCDSLWFKIVALITWVYTFTFVHVWIRVCRCVPFLCSTNVVPSCDELHHGGFLLRITGSPTWYLHRRFIMFTLSCLSTCWKQTQLTVVYFLELSMGSHAPCIIPILPGN